MTINATTLQAEGQPRRPTCSSCRKPLKTCLCASIPKPKRTLRGHLIVLQHPLESRRKLATVPLLQLCIENCIVLKSRNWKGGIHTKAEVLVQGALDGQYPFYILFPAMGSTDIREVAAGPAHKRALQQHARQQASPSDHPESADAQPAYLLLAIDGTWEFAKEMFQALPEKFLPPNGPGIVVQLPASMQQPVMMPQQQEPAPEQHHTDAAPQPADQEQSATAVAPFRLRTEPSLGCLTTMEAIARALDILEEAPEGFLAALMAPLERMVQMQAQYDPAMRARVAGGDHVVETKLARSLRKAVIM